MQFEIRSRGKAERLARERGKGRVQAVERFADADACGIARGADRSEAALAGESLRSHHAGRKAAALLVHPSDDDEVARRHLAPLRQ